MATRPRSSSSSKRSATPPPPQTPTTEVDNSESVPELRLLGSLEPVPNREERIAMSAYWRAAKRQFSPGGELDDWLEAEREIDSEDSKKRDGATD